MIGNVRASVQKAIQAIADAGVKVVTFGGDLVDPCYAVEWLSAEVPMGGDRYGRNVRIHVRGSQGDMAIDQRMDRLIDGLHLPKNQAGKTWLQLKDYEGKSEAVIGVIELRRQAGGVLTGGTPKAGSLYYAVLPLVVVYQRR